MNLKVKGLITSLLLTLSIGIVSPAKTSVYATETTTPPSIVGNYAVTLDYETGEIIYAKDIDTRTYPASTTKVLTGLLLAENKNKEDSILYTDAANNQPEYSLSKNYPGLINVGQTLSADDVMKILLLFSGNDTAIMVADSISGSESAFAELMNKKVSDLGLKNTHFVTANGLHDDNHYSTAYDLAVILREAYKNPWVSQTMKLKNAVINFPNGKNVTFENRNRFVGQNGNIGGKTGFTTPAGRCLIAVYERDGRKIVGAVLKSAYDFNDETVFNDMNKIIDYSFNAKQTVFLEKGKSVGTIPVEYKAFKFFGPTKTIDVPMTLAEDITYYDNDINKSDFTYAINPLTDIDAWKLATNPTSATLNVSDQRLYAQNYKLNADISVGAIIKANIGFYALIFVGALAVIVIILLIIRIVNVRKRKRRRRRKMF